MSDFQRNSLITLVTLFLVLGLVIKVLHAQHTSLQRLDFSKIPYAVGQWQGEDLPVTPDVTEILGTEDVLLRHFKRPDETQTLLLAIVYSDNNRDTFHPPELCYVGSGLELRDKRQVTLSLQNQTQLQVVELLLNTSNQSLKAWYWFAAGNRFVASYYRQQAYFFLDALRGRPLRGALIRVSVQGEALPEDASAYAFMDTLMPDLRNLFLINNDNRVN